LPPNRGIGANRQPLNDLDPRGNLPDRIDAKADSRRAYYRPGDAAPQLDCAFESICETYS
jgi:hypothetical protein